MAMGGPGRGARGSSSGGMAQVVQHGSASGGGASSGKKVKPGSFQSFGLLPDLEKAIMKMGYKMPTPIQRRAIPLIAEGRDVVAMARTGSGKTGAFLIPLLNRLELKHSLTVGVRAVVLSPTRELAMQSIKFCRQLCSVNADLRLCLLVGGQAMEAQFERLAQNPDIVFATPGRLMHHQVEADLSLQRVDMLVFDEADRLFELGFAEQLQKILEGTPPHRQCLLFSATLPAQLMQFTRLGLKDPEMVRLDVENSLSEDLDLEFLYTRKEEKIPAAMFLVRKHLGLLGGGGGGGEGASSSSAPGAAGAEVESFSGGGKGKSGGKGKGKAGKGKGKGKGSKGFSGDSKGGGSQKGRGVIMFVATRHHVEFFGSLFRRAKIPNVYHVYGTMDQVARNEQVSGFHRTRGLLITTDVAARGIDIPLLEHVINYDFPPSAKLFIHRAGRTARAGQKGVCSSLLGKDDLPYAMELLLFLGRKVEVPGIGAAVINGGDEMSSTSSAPAPTEESGARSSTSDRKSGAGSSGQAAAEGTLDAAVAAGSSVGGSIGAAGKPSTVRVEKKNYLGSVPSLNNEVEEYERLYHSNEASNDLVTLQKSMIAAYQQYYKTRPSASKQSVRRSKQLLEECGGPQILQGIPHPSYGTLDVSALAGILSTVKAARGGRAGISSSSSKDGGPSAGSSRGGIAGASSADGRGSRPLSAADYIASLQKFRPTVEKENDRRGKTQMRVLSKEAVAGMSKLVNEQRDFRAGCEQIREEVRRLRRGEDASDSESEGGDSESESEGGDILGDSDAEPDARGDDAAGGFEVRKAGASTSASASSSKKDAGAAKGTARKASGKKAKAARKQESKRPLSKKERRDLKKAAAVAKASPEGGAAAGGSKDAKSSTDVPGAKNGDAPESEDEFEGWNVSVMDTGGAQTKTSDATARRQSEQLQQSSKDFDLSRARKRRLGPSSSVGGDSTTGAPGSADGSKAASSSENADFESLGDLFKGDERAKRYKSEAFFLSTDRSANEDAKDRGLDLEQYRMDMLGDDGKSLQAQKSVMKWDAKKKKFLPTLVGADGRAIRKKNRRNEAGKKVTGAAEKTDIYAKWARNKKVRIQGVGEMEGSRNASMAFLGGEESGPSTVAFGDEGGDDDAQDNIAAHHERNKKPVVPFHGQVEDKYLTNKQKRLLARNEKLQRGDVVRGDDAVKGKAGAKLGVSSGARRAGGVKSAEEIKKDRKKDLQKRLKNDKEYRKKKAADLKKQYWDRHAERMAARQAKPRSFQIYVGGKKDTSKKMQKRNRVKKPITFM